MAMSVSKFSLTSQMAYQERICGQRGKSPENSDTTGKIKRSMSPPPISESSDKAKATMW
jgi:hypothetical protein